MKNTIATIAFTMVFAAATAMPAFAQSPYSNMTPQQMQQMQKAMLKGAAAMQKCMSGANMEAMQSLQQKAAAMGAEIKKLCDAGKRDEAQEYAMRMGEEINNADDVKAARECGEQMEQMMQGMPSNIWDPEKQAKKSKKERHICDAYAETNKMLMEKR